jgi:hypothetical protein
VLIFRLCRLIATMGKSRCSQKMLFKKTLQCWHHFGLSHAFFPTKIKSFQSSLPWRIRIPYQADVVCVKFAVFYLSQHIFYTMMSVAHAMIKHSGGWCTQVKNYNFFKQCLKMKFHEKFVVACKKCSENIAQKCRLKHVYFYPRARIALRVYFLLCCCCC